MLSNAERIEQAKDRYKKHIESGPGQRDLFTGETRKSAKTQGKFHWITLKSHDGEPTTHVEISDDGKVRKGPAGLTGKSLFDHESKSPDTEKPKIVKVPARPAVHHGTARREPAAPASHLRHLPDGRVVGPTVMSIDDLHVDPERFQYKVSGINKETGTNSEIRDNTIYNPELGGQLLVWKDPADGKTYVVNGHHRAELAKKSPRSSEIGEFNGSHPVYYINARDHVEARAHGALANIAEGRGTATDAAKFMRDMGVGPEHFKKHGISHKGALAAAAMELKKLSPMIFQKLTNGMISEGRAAMIGKHLPNEDAQDQLYRWIEKHEKQPGDYSDRKVAEMAKSTAAMKPKQAGMGGGLLGDWFDEFPIEQRADIADHVARTLSGETKSLRDASSERRKGVIEAEGDNKIDAVTNRARAMKSAAALEEFDHRVNAQGHPIAQLLDQYAERLASEPKKRTAILKEALAEVRKLAEAGSGGKTDDGAADRTHVRPLQGDGPGRRDSEQPASNGVSRFSRLEAAEANYRYYCERVAGKNSQS